VWAAAGVLLAATASPGQVSEGRRSEGADPAGSASVRDIDGIWAFGTITPLERPGRFADKAILSAEEIEAYERLAAEREDGRPPDDGRSNPSVHAVWWLDYGKTVVETGQTSLIVDPPDGRIPPLTPEAKTRMAAAREARTHGPADGPEVRSLFERCLTKGLPEVMLPAGYNNNVQINVFPGYAVIFTEMIHEARIVPLDGRPHLPAHVRGWMGDSRGWWEGNSLVVETRNFTDKTSFRGSGANLHLLERFTRVDEDTLEYRFTVTDPTTWTRPWTVAYPMSKTDGPIYEYACHEGNYGLRNILRYARIEEAGESGAK
jgi:hypothetical protein